MTELTGVAYLRSILPDEFIDKLALIASNWRKDKFMVGDIRNSLKAHVDEHLLAVSTVDIDDFLADCLNHEIEPRTVRYYAMISYAFPEPIRAEYGMLSHAHFAYAHTFGDKAKSVLDLARDREMLYGKVPSCAWLRAAMSGYIYEKQADDFPVSTLDAAGRLYDDIPNIPEDESEPAQPSATGWLTGLHKAVQFSLNHIDAVPMESELRLKLLDLLGQVDSLLSRYIVMV